MQFELSGEDQAQLGRSIMETAVGKVFTKAVSEYLNNDYRLSQTVEEVLRMQIANVARDMLENDDDIKDRVNVAVREAFTSELIEKLAGKLTTANY